MGSSSIFNRLRSRAAPLLRPMLEHIGLLRRPALWWLSRRHPRTYEVDGCTYEVDPRDFGVSLELHATGGYEEGTRHFCLEAIEPGMTFIDIGAHVGLFTIPIAQRVGERGRVFAFEPNPSNRELLERNLSGNDIDHVRVLPSAVSDAAGTMKLHCSPYNTGDHQLYYTGRGRDAIDVEVVSLDGFLEEQGGEVDLVKMDVQGAEAKVIAGMERTIEGNPGIIMVIELSPWMLEDIGDDPLALLEGLEGRGFSLATMEEGTGILTGGSCREILERCAKGSYLNLVARREGVEA